MKYTNVENTADAFELIKKVKNYITDMFPAYIKFLYSL